MDPNSGQIFSPEVVAGLHRQAKDRVADIEARKLADRLVPIPGAELASVERMNIRERKGWAKSRNERKRARQAR